jgi:preprotein translocase subunit SecA
VPDDTPLESKMVSHSIEGAQKKVEGRNFDIRRHVLQYDDVMNKHRDIIYKRRQKVLQKIAAAGDASGSAETAPLHQEILEGMKADVDAILVAHAASDDFEEWNVKGLVDAVAVLHSDFKRLVTEESVRSYKDKETLREALQDLVLKFFEHKCGIFGQATVTNAENLITLRSIDSHWMDHIDDMSHLREQVAFAGYAQRDPLIEYQDQGFRRFQQLLATINATITRTILQADFAPFTPEAVRLMRAQEDAFEREQGQTNEAQIEGELTQTGVDAASFIPTATGDQLPAVNAQSGGTPVAAQRLKAEPMHTDKVGRNDPCPCGSGKKYKKCHGKNE